MNSIEKKRRLMSFLKKILPEGGKERVQQTLESVASPLESGQFDLSSIWNLKPGQETTMTDEQSSTLEAIILPKERPVIDIINDDFAQPEAPFADLYTDATRRQNILKAIPCVGRIGVPGLPQYPFAGTGFVVGENLLMTNRHVAELVCNGLGTTGLSFRSGQDDNTIDFKKENGPDVTANSKSFRISDILMIHPYWDMALFRTVGLEGISPLILSTTPIGTRDSNEIVVIGYPAFDPRNDAALQMQIFRSVFNVKRLQPGKVNGLAPTSSFNKTVTALLHDASTLGGNSGSVVLNTVTGLVEGLHFSGVYLVSNYAVPAFGFARDGHVTSAGVKFDAPIAPSVGPWDDYWKTTEATASGPGGGVPPPPSNGAGPGSNNDGPPPRGPVRPTPSGEDAGIHFTLPLEFSVRLAPVASVRMPATTTLNGAGISERPAVLSDSTSGDTTEIPPSPIQEVPSDTVGSFEWLRRSGFDLELAVFLAQASQTAYGNEEMTGAWAVAQGFTTTQFFNRGNIQGFWCVADDTALLAFRGTSNPGQWLLDARFVPASHPWGTVHIGFRDGLEAVEPDLLAFEPAVARAKYFWVCGHSLGGALAVLAAARFKIRKIVPTASLYTYGQPKVGFSNFADAYGVNLPGALYRFVNQEDIVPRVPPPPYQHCGLAKRIIHPGQLESVATGATPQIVDHDALPCSEQELAEKRAVLAKASVSMALESIDVGSLIPFIHDHYIGEYIRLLSDIKNAQSTPSVLTASR